MHLIAIINNLRPQDVLDILFLSAVAYHLYLWFRGTKALRALVGLLVLGVVFTVARTWGLFLTTWVFQILWQVLVILLIILFQSEIRQVLERFNPIKTMTFRRGSPRGQWITELCKGIFSLASRKIGALVVVEQKDRIDEWISGGQDLEAEPSAEILMSIFQKESPLHDGAIVIREGQIEKVACYLPLSSETQLPKEWGTRHRAARGLTERCDATIIVVSEERGEISLARAQEMIKAESMQGLAELLEEISPSLMKIPLWKRGGLFFYRRWHIKLGTLAFVSILWLLLAGQQDFEATFRVPVEIRNLPAYMKILEPTNPEVEVRVRGLRKDASTLDSEAVRAEIDLSAAAMGKEAFAMSREQVFLNNDRVYVVRIDPSVLYFKFEEYSTLF
jgi:uncharacterized protein (TIGR00159 family)